MHRRPNRRQFIKSTTAVAAGFSALAHATERGWVVKEDATSSLGGLVKDPNQILDLPENFSYTMLSRWGETMDDGLLVPGLHDGMAAFNDQQGRVVLVRNHEVGIDSPNEYGAFGANNEHLATIDASRLFDAGAGDKPCLGGTTTVVYDTTSKEVVRHYLSLAGTGRNCAGGPTPWNTWLTCEEWVQTKDEMCAEDHGWVFEVPASSRPMLYTATPIKPMGRFYHEAVAIGPIGGCAYLTEDRNDGVFYRYIPDVKTQLAKGGRLQALKVRDKATADVRNWIDPESETPAIKRGEAFAVEWIDVHDVESPNDDLRYRAAADGAAIFARSEGIWSDDEGLFFACTTGGVARLGQVWQYVPSPYEGTDREHESPATLRLFLESEQNGILQHCDNLTITPKGDLFMAEDERGVNGLVRVQRNGAVERFARHRGTSSELAGVCMSPDGATLFANIQRPGITVAITGPF